MLGRNANTQYVQQSDQGYNTMTDRHKLSSTQAISQPKASRRAYQPDPKHMRERHTAARASGLSSGLLTNQTGYKTARRKGTSAMRDCAARQTRVTRCVKAQHRNNPVLQEVQRLVQHQTTCNRPTTCCHLTPASHPPKQRQPRPTH